MVSETDEQSARRPLPSDLLPLLATAFPHTFFGDARQVKPLKIGIHRDLEALRQADALPIETDPQSLKRFLRWYTRRTAYLTAVARGDGRIDLTGAVVEDEIPESIREQARQDMTRQQQHQAVRDLHAPQRNDQAVAAALLPVLAAAFPKAFYTDPKQVQPLTAFIYRDLLKLARANALPDGVDRTHLKSFLRWYGRRTSYLNALTRGAGRIDLTGTVMVTDIPTALRQRAREEVQRRRQKTARTLTPPAPRVAAQTASPTAPSAAPFNLEDLYSMAIDAKLEVTLKFSTLPQAKPAGAGKMAFALRTPDGQFVVAEISNKVWAKLVKANTDWPSWVAALTGAMGERTDKGFILMNPGLQVFEKKPKAAPEASAPTATAPSPASPKPAEPVAPPPMKPAAPPLPAAPVTVTTGAGTATVTKRAPLSLKRDASTEGTSG